MTVVRGALPASMLLLLIAFGTSAHAAVDAPGVDFESRIDALEARLERLDDEAVWERRRIVRQIDDLRIEAMVPDVVDYAKRDYPGRDGLRIPVYVFRPAAPAPEPAPAVIYAHGGQHGWFRPRSVGRVLAMVERGWVVVAPDYRGSTGYSKEFYEAADYGGAEIDDMLAARDFVAGLPGIDPQRIAILGLSHGGYNAVMALIRAPGTFAAAVDFFGPTDLVWRVTASPDENPNSAPGDREYFARMIGGTLDEVPERYLERSPRYMADRIEDPLLILHGAQDAIVLPRESAWLADALEQAGHEDFALHVIEGANHGFPADAWDRGWAIALDFLERIFGGR